MKRIATVAAAAATLAIALPGALAYAAPTNPIPERPHAPSSCQISMKAPADLKSPAKLTITGIGLDEEVAVVGGGANSGDDGYRFTVVQKRTSGPVVNDVSGPGDYGAWPANTSWSFQAVCPDGGVQTATFTTPGKPKATKSATAKPKATKPATTKPKATKSQAPKAKDNRGGLAKTGV